MNDSPATHTIINQSKVFSLDAPVRSIRTEVTKTDDSAWAFNVTESHLGKAWPTQRKGTFGSKSEAEEARRDFIVEQRRTAGPDLYIE